MIKSRRVRSAALAAAGAFVLGSASLALAQSQFQGLGDLTDGVFDSAAAGISADGNTVVGYGTDGSGPQAFRWTVGGTMQGLGELAGGDYRSLARAVSADGSVIVGYSSSTNSTSAFHEAFRWTAGGGLQPLGDFSGSAFDSQAHGVSADGSTIVGYGTGANGLEAFRWTSGSGLQGLGDLAGGEPNSYAYGISSDGSVIVGAGQSASGQEAYRYTGATMTGLGDLAGGVFSSTAWAVSANGQVLVGAGTSTASDPFTEAFRYTGSTMTGLGDLAGGSANSAALAVSADGSVVVGYGTIASDASAGFIWDATRGMRNINQVLAGYGIDMTGWTLQSVTGVSADGHTIVGNGTNPSGDFEAWVAVLVDPASWKLDTNGNWSASANWTADVPNYTAAVATFGTVATAARSITIDVPATVATLNFDGARSYALAGAGANTLTLDNRFGAVAINVTGSASHSISDTVILKDAAAISTAAGTALTLSGALNNAAGVAITKSGPGALTIDATQTHGATATFAATAGTTNLNSDAGSAAAANLAVSLTGAGTAVNFGSTQHLKSLNVGAGSTATVVGNNKVLVTRSLTVAGSLNLKDNDLIVGNDAAPAVMADVRALIKAGQITTDVALAAPKTGMLGYAQGNDSLLSPSLAGQLGGEAFQNGSVIVKYTYQGDADLDGDADGNDIGTWALNFTGELGNPASPSKFWTNGDWDYDGDVDGNDAGSWALNFTGELGGSGLAINAPGASPEAVAMLEGMGFTVVPEPATLGLLAIGAMGLLARRRRA